MRNKLPKKLSKKEKEQNILLGLIDLFIKTGKPIGSNSLKESGFDEFSSATIRNYFNKLEKEELLTQAHSSGGRTPTAKAFREYANAHLEKQELTDKEEKTLLHALKTETKEIGKHLQIAAETLSEMLDCSLFLSSPRFDQDFLKDVKILLLENNKLLIILITEFGLVHTENLYSPKSLESSIIPHLEKYFLWRMGKSKEKPELLSESYMKLFHHFYNEILFRHLIQSAPSQEESLYKTGFAKLLNYPEFQDTSSLASSLTLFENPQKMHLLLRESMKINRITSWIGEELSEKMAGATVIAIPYHINKTPVGAIATLSPIRIPYGKYFSILQTASQFLSEALTKIVYKYKISFSPPNISEMDSHLLNSPSILLENKKDS